MFEKFKISSLLYIKFIYTNLLSYLNSPYSNTSFKSSISSLESSYDLLRNSSGLTNTFFHLFILEMMYRSWKVVCELLQVEREQIVADQEEGKKFLCLL